MPENNIEKMPPFNRGILAEAANRLPEGLTQEYINKLNILMKTEEDDPILAAAVVMGAYSVILGKVPDEVEKVLKRFQETLSSEAVLKPFDTRVGDLYLLYEETKQNMRSFKTELRLARDAVKTFEQNLKKATESRDQQLASVANHDFSVRKWLIVHSTLHFVAIVVFLYWLWKSSH